MTYGIETKLANGTTTASQSLPGGRIFVGVINRPADNTGGLVSNYSYPLIPGGDKLKIMQIGAGAHTWSTSTDALGKAVVSLTSYNSLRLNFPDYTIENTLLYIFTTGTIEPDMGILTVNNSGERITSNIYPCSEFLQAVTFNGVPTTQLNVGAGYIKYTYSTVASLGSGRTKIVLWELPDTTSDCWFFGDTSPVNSIVTFSYLCPTGTTVKMPTAYVFAVDNLSNSTDSYGIRILDNSNPQKLLFDSGLNHMVIKGFESTLTYPTTVGTVNSLVLSNLSGTPAFFVPRYFKENWFNVKNSLESSGRGVDIGIRKVGTTLYSKAILTANLYRDEILSGTYSYGQSLYLTQVVIDSTLYGTANTNTYVTTNSPPTYILSSSVGTAANEGTSAAITLATTNIPNGTLVPYTISGTGITSADIGGASLTGNFTVNNNTSDTLTLNFAADLLSEGAEYLFIAAGDSNIYIVIGDTSVAASTYSVSSDVNSVNEGGSVVFTLTTTNVASGTSVPYSITGVSSADVGNASLSGNFTALTGTTLTLNITADALTEGTETLTVTAGGSSKSITINDTSLSVPTYSVTSNTSSVNEGGSVTFTLTTTNVASGTLVPYSITGISSADIGNASLSGNFTAITGTTLTLNITADALTEGTETVTLSAGGSSTSVTINDTSTSPPTYLVTSNVSSVNEGGSVTFTLATTNVASGTLVPYSITGVSSADIGYTGLFSNFTAVTGTTLTLNISADALDEGPETLTVTAGGSSASVTINDTSRAPPTYLVTSNVSSVNEGGSVTFTLATTNVASGTLIFYSITGVSSTDIGGASLTGNFTAVTGTTLTLNISADALDEGAETLVLSAAGSSASVTINDTSRAPPTYSVAVSTNPVSEGGSVVFTLTTTNVGNGTLVPYSISGTGITSADIGGISLTGNFTVGALSGINNTATATLTVNITADLFTEGAENLTLSAGGSSASVSINDTSTNPATYSIAASPSTVNEGGSVTFTLTTTEVADGTAVYYYISGVSSSDISGASTTGYFLAGTVKTQTFTIAADATTEGSEVMQMVLNVTGQSASVTINDTSQNPSYSVTSSVSTVNEGGSVTFTLTTTDVASGTLIPYSITGVSSADIGSASLTGNFTAVTGNTLTLSITADALTESAEILVLSAAGSSASVTINDTSMTPTYSVTSSVSSVNEGGSVIFTLTTANLASGTSVPYSITGVSSADIGGASLSGNFTAVTGTTLTLNITADALTEGTETVTLSAGGSSASVTINDTSMAPIYSVASSASSVNEGGSVVFTLTTTNVASGTLVPYSITGISSADIGGTNLTGNFTAITGNTLTLSITADVLTEGTEILTLSVGGSSTSVTINDTSLAPTYSITPNVSSVNEGGSVTFTVSTTNVPTGTTVYWIAAGAPNFARTLDLTTWNGSSTVNSVGTASFTVYITADQITEGTETFRVYLTSDSGWANDLAVSGFITINDTSLTRTYSLVANPYPGPGVDEGWSVGFTVTTTNVPDGTQIPFTLSGTSVAADITDGVTSGTFYIYNNTGTTGIGIVADNLTEGTETIICTLTGLDISVSVNINDTSILQSSGLVTPAYNGLEYMSPGVAVAKTLNMNLRYTVSGGTYAVEGTWTGLNNSSNNYTVATGIWTNTPATTYEYSITGLTITYPYGTKTPSAAAIPTAWVTLAGTVTLCTLNLPGGSIGGAGIVTFNISVRPVAYPTLITTSSIQFYLDNT